MSKPRTKFDKQIHANRYAIFAICFAVVVAFGLWVQISYLNMDTDSQLAVGQMTHVIKHVPLKVKK
jgi:hypothetical protein